jgi:small subunit ribosomal protein S1
MSNKTEETPVQPELEETAAEVTAEAGEVAAEAVEVAEEAAEEATETEEVEESEETEDIEEVEEEEEILEDEGAEEVAKEIRKIKKEEVSLENFNWDAYSNKHNFYSSSDRANMEAMYDKTLSAIVENEIIDGKVSAMNKREVVINIGFKSEGIVSMNEFRYNPNLKVGDMVEVYVESSEDKKGQLLLSHKKARTMRSWDRINKALENDEIISGYIKCRTKGGMIVDVFGIEAFLPGSQIDVKPIRDYDVYVGKTPISDCQDQPRIQERGGITQALIEAELEQQKKEIISKLEKGRCSKHGQEHHFLRCVHRLGGVERPIHSRPLLGPRKSPRKSVQLDQKLNVVSWTSTMPRNASLWV